MHYCIAAFFCQGWIVFFPSLTTASGLQVSLWMRDRYQHVAFKKHQRSMERHL